MSVPEVRVVGVGTELPGPPVSNAMLARRFGMNSVWEQWIDSFVGTASRHLAVDLESGEVRCGLADLATAAGRAALEQAEVEPAEVGLIVMGTATPDALMPATVNVVADRIGIDGIPSYQLQSGCSGAVQALDVAATMLRAGRCRTALVLGGDVCAKHLDLTLDLHTLAPEQLVNVVLFGDGAGAAVLTTEPTAATTATAAATGAAGAGDVVLRDAFVRLVGRGRPPGQTVEWFGLADRDADRPAGGEDYKAIEESVPELAADTLTELLDRLDWKPDDLDHLLPPQLSGAMTGRIVERLAVRDAAEVSCVARTGNNGNALPFFQLEQLLPRMAAGDRAAGVAIESSKWIEAGFALEKLEKVAGA
ncbi:MAG: 3-oxoacyl-ACP synthase III family protein [Mycobacteriales bacterium]